ncbi:MAG: iron-containing redox enzyme family protein [Acidobacteriota bacterium]|nr:iron-containing redox enzyme family protein [Acidobacteriota bacterium]
MEFWRAFAELRASHDVLRHPFYARWNAGELGTEELAHYAAEYRHAVLALAHASSGAAEAASGDPELAAELADHAVEEREHIALWDAFLDAAGGRRTADPAPETLECAEVWAGDPERPLLRSLAALHAIESAQPAVARTKRVGLLTHYGYQEGPATEYFRVHEERDVEHAELSRVAIDRALAAHRGSPAARARQEAELLSEAEAALRGNWLLLDGVERAAAAR